MVQDVRYMCECTVGFTIQLCAFSKKGKHLNMQKTFNVTTRHVLKVEFFLK